MAACLLPNMASMQRPVDIIFTAQIAQPQTKINLPPPVYRQGISIRKSRPVRKPALIAVPVLSFEIISQNMGIQPEMMAGQQIGIFVAQPIADFEFTAISPPTPMGRFVRPPRMEVRTTQRPPVVQGNLCPDIRYRQRIHNQIGTDHHPVYLQPSAITNLPHRRNCTGQT